MNNEGSKKLLVLYILWVLERYSDNNHPLSQAGIIDYISRDFDMTCERKAVARNISLLLEAGVDISTYEDNKRGYYINSRTFDESELRLLIDGVLASKHIPKRQALELIEKLNGLAPEHFKKRMRHIHSIYGGFHSNNTQLFYNISILDKAIDSRLKVRFIYNRNGMDKKLHPIRDFKAYVNPYQMAVVNGRYYLIGNNDKFDDVTHWRLDRISDIEITNMSAKPVESLRSHENGLKLPEYIGCHPYLFGGDSVRCKLAITEGMIDACIDWFGDGITFCRDGDSLTVTVLCNEEAMLYWALQYGQSVEVLEPQSLRDKVKSAVNTNLHSKCN